MSGLNIGDQVKLLLLQRVHDGHITQYGGDYFDEGQRVSWHTVQVSFQVLTEVGRLELNYPPDSGVWRQQDYGPLELVKGVHFGLTKAEVTRRASLTERGLAEYKELCERAHSAESPGTSE